MFYISVYLLFSMLAVIWFDVTRFLIPNWLVGSLLALYPVMLLLTHAPVDWKMALAGMLIVFAVGYITFLKNWMGGGDVKLLTVLALWAGWHHLFDFLFLVAIYGGVFAIGVWLVRKVWPHIPKKIATPRILRDGQPIPYGVAIALGFVTLVWLGQVPGIH